MEPIATYEEIAKMDDQTFIKTFKEVQLNEAKKVEDAKAEAVKKAAMIAELSAFDEGTKKLLGELESKRSMERTAIEKKYMETPTKEV